MCTYNVNSVSGESPPFIRSVVTFAMTSVTPFLSWIPWSFEL